MRFFSHPSSMLRLVAAGTVLALAAAPLLAQVTGSLGINNDRLQGTHPSGQVLLFSPDPVQLGSSVSHWDTALTPNALMEPFINADLPFLGLDLTPALMQDIGWQPGTSTIVIHPLDNGFDDPREFDGAPGNDATTLGEARVNLVNAVLAAWSSTLESSVDIDVLVAWTPLPCSSNGVVLAFAGTTFIFRDDGSELPNADTWYHAALTEALAGMDITNGPPFLDDMGRIIGGDLIVVINSAVDDECAGAGTGYYYGLDGQNPNNQIDLAPVVLHEVGHGLGFSNFTDEETGQWAGDAQNGFFPGIFDHFTFDHTQGRNHAEMTDAQRIESTVNFRQLSWSGAAVTAEAPGLLDTGVPELVISSPAQIAGTYTVGTAQFGPPLNGAVAGELFCLEDGVDPDAGDTSPLNGCSPATNPAEIAGKIALIDRGDCFFTDKALNAQAAGAIGAIVINTQGNTALGLGGDPDAPVAIPTVSVGQRDGELLRRTACGDPTIRLLNGRFEVTARWTDFDGNSDLAQAQPLTDATSAFTFFSPENIELIVKVLDACEIEGFNNFWVFAAGLTNVEVELTVTDTQTGQVNTYFNPLRNAFEAVQDTSAFSTCP